MPRLDCVLCFVDDDDGGGGSLADATASAEAKAPAADKAPEAPEKKELWGLGSVGGFQCYVSSDGDGEGGEGGEEGAGSAADASQKEDAAVYRRDVSDSDGVLNVPAIGNALSVVLCEPGVLDFVKYVSGDAPSSRWDVRYELSVLSEVVAEDEDG